MSLFLLDPGPINTRIFPTDPLIIQSGKNLWDYLNGLRNNTTNKVIAGQRWVDYNQRIFNSTGKWCGILNICLANSQQGTWAAYGSDATSRQTDILNWWNAGGIILYDFLLRDPVTQNACATGAAPIITTAQADQIMTDGHTYNNNLKYLLEKNIAVLLWLQEQGVPVIIRNFAEHNGTGFWFLDNPRLPQLYRYCRNYVINRGVHNVLWAHNVSHWAGSGTQGPVDDPKQFLQYYPGDDVIDILSFDMYANLPFASSGFDAYDKFKSAGKQQPIIIWEFGVKTDYNDTTKVDMRNIINTIRSRCPDVVGWSCWSVTWSMDPAYNNNITETLNDSWVVTRDEIPDLTQANQPTPGTRNAKLWPFSSESAINRPIGSGAVLQDYPLIRTASGAVLNSTSWSIAVALDNPSDPLVHVTQADQCGEGNAFTALDVRIPVGMTGSPPTTCPRDGFLVAVQGTRAQGFHKFQRTSNTSGTGAYHGIGDYDDIITGTGYKPTLGWAGGGHWIGGFSFMCGLLRDWELDEVEAGTRLYFNHAVMATLAGSQLKQAIGGDRTTCLRWPATEVDGSFASSYTGNVPMGSLLAIPKSFDIEATSWTTGAKALARTLQKYGAYIMGRGGSGLTFIAELNANSTICNQMRTNLNAIRDQLRVVENNAITAVGGGGNYPAALWPIPNPILT